MVGGVLVVWRARRLVGASGLARVVGLVVRVLSLVCVACCVGGRASALVVTRLVGAGLCAVVASVPPPLGLSLLRCLVFVALLVPPLFSVAWGAPRPRAWWGAGCLRPWCGSALCGCVSGRRLGASPRAVGWRVLCAPPPCLSREWF